MVLLRRALRWFQEALLVRGRVDGGAQHWLAAAPQEGSLAAARRGERERRLRLCCEKVSTSTTAWRRSSRPSRAAQKLLLEIASALLR